MKKKKYVIRFRSVNSKEWGEKEFETNKEALEEKRKWDKMRPYFVSEIIKL